ncbi:MAG: ribosome small subunit-dependent GTPase A [Gammaproteobacteria bacterium]
MSTNLFELGLVPYFIQQLNDPDLMTERLARVMAVQRSKSSVMNGASELTVDLSPDLIQASNEARPTVGDWVVLDASLTRIEQVLERKSLFKRLGAGSGTDLQPIAANIDVLFIVSSCNDEFKESRLERYLTLCVEAGATPVILLSKADLVAEADADDFIERARKVQADVAVEKVNALDPATLDNVRAWISNTTTVALVGSSGVGKSTLLNSLAGDTVVATGAIREDDKKGRHTTTHRQLHVLPRGGLVIDVPGMRELRVADIADSIGTVFADIERLASQCQFSDCHHESEPGCAVQQAIIDEQIDARRLSSYNKLQREDALATTTLAQKRAQGREFAKMVKTVKRFKQNRKPDY